MDGVRIYKFIRGRVLNDKNPGSIIKGIYEAWCINVGYLIVGLWADNRE